MCFNTRFRILGVTIFLPLHFGHVPPFMLLLYFVMMLVATPLTMRLSLGQNRFCYICRGSRDSEGYVFTETLSSISCLSRDRSTRNILKLSARIWWFCKSTNSLLISFSKKYLSCSFLRKWKLKQQSTAQVHKYLWVLKAMCSTFMEFITATRWNVNTWHQMNSQSTLTPEQTYLGTFRQYSSSLPFLWVLEENLRS